MSVCVGGREDCVILEKKSSLVMIWYIRVLACVHACVCHRNVFIRRIALTRSSCDLAYITVYKECECA